MSIALIEPIEDIGALGVRWRALEAYCDAGFFRSWTYLGCQAEERFAGAALLSVTSDGQDQALALLGQRHGRWFLNETGDPERDAPFIEHNGLLHRPGAGDTVLIAALRKAAAAGRPLVLSGIGDAHLRAARSAGWVGLQRTRLSPAVDLAAFDRPFVETLSANARGQIRRAQRLYGPALLLRRAGTLDEALGVFDRLVSLHQARWTARGKPGAFADPAIRRFHQTLIARAQPAGEADLLEIRAGERLIGTLYTFIANGRVLSYQSGFDYSQDAREKPGLVCHALAIEHYGKRGLRLYDFLGGEDRYKKTLAGGQAGVVAALYWATLRRWRSPAGLTEAVAARLRTRLSAWRRR